MDEIGVVAVEGTLRVREDDKQDCESSQSIDSLIDRRSTIDDVISPKLVIWWLVRVKYWNAFTHRLEGYVRGPPMSNPTGNLEAVPRLRAPVPRVGFFMYRAFHPHWSMDLERLEHP